MYFLFNCHCICNCSPFTHSMTTVALYEQPGYKNRPERVVFLLLSPPIISSLLKMAEKRAEKSIYPRKPEMECGKKNCSNCRTTLFLAENQFPGTPKDPIDKPAVMMILPKLLLCTYDNPRRSPRPGRLRALPAQCPWRRGTISRYEWQCGKKL